MAEKIIIDNPINSAADLVTPGERTRAGFISLALEKNYLAVPYVEEAKALKALAGKIKYPADLLTVSDLGAGLLTASGLSDKSLNYLTEDDKINAIKGLIEEIKKGKDSIIHFDEKYIALGELKGGIDPTGL